MHRILARTTLRHTLVSAFVFLLVCGTTPLAAAHGTGRPTLHDVLIVAHDNGTASKEANRFWFSMPSTIPTGWVEFMFENHGTQEHEAQIFRLKNGYSANDFFKALANPNVKESMQAIYRESLVVGGGASIEPGGRQDAISWIDPGRYVVTCFDSTSSGTPHFLLGMYTSFTAVAGTRTAVDPDEYMTPSGPAYSGTVVLGSYYITMPQQAMTRGWHIFKVINVSNQAHQMALSRVPTGTSRSQIQTCLTNEKACTVKGGLPADGGMNAIDWNYVGYAEVYLQPGEYLAACYVPDKNTGMPHALMGMYTLFTVK